MASHPNTPDRVRKQAGPPRDLYANEASQQGPGRGRYHFGRSLLCHHIDQSSKTCVPGLKGARRRLASGRGSQVPVGGSSGISCTFKNVRRIYLGDVPQNATEFEQRVAQERIARTIVICR